MNVPPLPPFALPPLLDRANSFILTWNTPHGIDTWLHNLNPDGQGVLTLQGCHIINEAAMEALILRAPPSIQTIDFSQCTFSDQAFDALLKGKKAPREWILDWAPEQLKRIKPDNLKNVHLTILPPKSPTAEDIELWNLVPKQSAPVPTYPVLVGNITREKCLAWWNKAIQTEWRVSGVFALNNDPKIYFYLDDTGAVKALFEVLNEKAAPIEVLNLTGVVFSEEVWTLFLNQFKFGYQIDDLSLDSVTLPQLRLLFQEWGEMMSQNMVTLNLSRGQGMRTTQEERTELADLLSKELPKLKKLESLKLDNWDLNFECGKRISEPQKKPENKALLLSQNTSKETWNSLIYAEEQPSVVIGDMTGAPVKIDSAESIENLFSALSEFHDAINFLSVRFTVDAWRTLLLLLYKKRSIKAVRFYNCQLNPSMIASLKSLSRLTSLTLNSNAALAEKEAFCQAVKTVWQNINLETLRLEDNLLTDRDIAAILPSLPGSLKKLCLAGNCITAKGESYLRGLSSQSSGGRYKRSFGDFDACQINLEENPI